MTIHLVGGNQHIEEHLSQRSQLFLDAFRKWSPVYAAPCKFNQIIAWKGAKKNNPGASSSRKKPSLMQVSLQNRGFTMMEKQSTIFPQTTIIHVYNNMCFEFFKSLVIRRLHSDILWLW